MVKLTEIFIVVSYAAMMVVFVATILGRAISNIVNNYKNPRMKREEFNTLKSKVSLSDQVKEIMAVFRDSENVKIIMEAPPTLNLTGETSRYGQNTIKRMVLSPELVQKVFVIFSDIKKEVDKELEATQIVVPDESEDEEDENPEAPTEPSESETEKETGDGA